MQFNLNSLCLDSVWPVNLHSTLFTLLYYVQCSRRYLTVLCSSVLGKTKGYISIHNAAKLTNYKVCTSQWKLSKIISEVHFIVMLILFSMQEEGFRNSDLRCTDLKVLFDYINLYFTVGFNVFLIYKFVAIDTLWFMHPESHQVSGLRQAVIGTEQQPLHRKANRSSILKYLLQQVFVICL